MKRIASFAMNSARKLGTTLDSHQLIRIHPRTGDLQESPSKKIEKSYRKCELPVPNVLQTAPGIEIVGRKQRSFVFSTDPYIIRNCNADAVFAVAPFTCQTAIIDALIKISERPVFVGVAGSKTSGDRSCDLARVVEMQGAAGICVSPAADIATIKKLAHAVDIPLIVSISDTTDYSIARIMAGADIVNVAAGCNTTVEVSNLRALHPEIPIIASAGKTSESAHTTIMAGADALTWTPPSIIEIEKQLMQGVREVEQPA